MIRRIFDVTLRPVHLFLRRVISTLVDRRLRIVTTDEGVARKLMLDVRTYRRTWRATPWLACWRFLRRSKLGPDDVVVDLGCGAGRFVALASRHRIGGVVGVDIDHRFAAVATDNIANVRGRRAPAHVVNGDALDFPIPERAALIFIYNSFGDEILRPVLERVKESFRHHPRHLRIVYLNPKHETVADEVLAGARKSRVRVSWRPGAAWALSQTAATYEFDPSGPP